MNVKLRSSEQAYRIGIGVGQAAADFLRIEIVAGIYTRTMESLDEACRVRGPFDRDILGVRSDCGAFADDFERGWWSGLQSRCSDIIERLNIDSVARLPEPLAVADDGWDGD